MRLTEQEAAQARAQGEKVWNVECRWASSYSSKYSWFTDEKEAKDYAKKRFQGLKNHKTAGPKCNGKKVPPEDLVEESGEKPWWCLVLGASTHDGGTWWFGGTFTVLVS